MKRIVARSPTSSCKKVRANLLRKGTNVSISTISHRLSTEFGLKYYKPAKKTRLTPTMKKKRLEFARNKANFLIGGPILLQMMVVGMVRWMNDHLWRKPKMHAAY